jgi:hypothetical protein
MKVNITNKEYRTLLTMLEIAQWVNEAYNTETDGESGPYWEVQQRFLALAKDFGCGHLVEQHGPQGHHYPTDEFDESDPHLAILDQYSEDAFWETLEARLVRRDMVRLHGLERVQAMEPLERMKGEDPFREHYAREFEENGIERLEIVETLPGLAQASQELPTRKNDR